jgi:predicted PurR-regulated permease PerM
MELTKLNLKNFFFIAVLIILGWVMLQLFSPFLNIIIVGLVLVQIFHPIYDWLETKLKIKGVASILTTLVALFTVVMPLILISILLISEIARVLPSGVNGQVALSPSIMALEDSVNNVIRGANEQLASLAGDSATLLQPINLGEIGITILSSIQAQIFPIVNNVIQFSVNALFTAFMLIVTLLYLFPAYRKLPRFVSRVSPLDDKLDLLLVNSFRATTKAVIFGSFLVAIAQASAVLIALLILNIGSPVLLWVIMVILSLIPVGSGLVWAPVGVGLILTGQPLAGVLLIIYSAVIINVIDTTLRPYVMKDAVKLHPLIVIFSAIGGIGLFGPLGILYGPVLVVFFASLMDVYTRDFAGVKLHHQDDEQLPNTN